MSDPSEDPIIKILEDRGIFQNHDSDENICLSVSKLYEITKDSAHPFSGEEIFTWKKKCMDTCENYFQNGKNALYQLDEFSQYLDPLEFMILHWINNPGETIVVDDIKTTMDQARELDIEDLSRPLKERIKDFYSLFDNMNQWDMEDVAYVLDQIGILKIIASCVHSNAIKEKEEQSLTRKFSGMGISKTNNKRACTANRPGVTAY